MAHRMGSLGKLLKVKRFGDSYIPRAPLADSALSLPP